MTRRRLPPVICRIAVIRTGSAQTATGRQIREVLEPVDQKTSQLVDGNGRYWARSQFVSTAAGSVRGALEARHANEHEPKPAAVIERPQLLEACGLEPVGFIDDEQLQRMQERLGLDRIGHRGQLAVGVAHGARLRGDDGGDLVRAIGAPRSRRPDDPVGLDEQQPVPQAQDLIRDRARAIDDLGRVQQRRGALECGQACNSDQGVKVGRLLTLRSRQAT